MAKTPTKKADVKPDPQSGMDPTPAKPSKAKLDAQFAEADAKGDAKAAADLEALQVGLQVRGY